MFESIIPQHSHDASRTRHRATPWFGVRRLPEDADATGAPWAFAPIESALHAPPPAAPFTPPTATAQADGCP